MVTDRIRKLSEIFDRLSDENQEKVLVFANEIFVSQQNSLNKLMDSTIVKNKEALEDLAQ